ncbi:MAG: HAD family phosphatase [Planctomycetia bacterium]|nr:HAD family phosphatase [Planctomycetia bacterium]
MNLPKIQAVAFDMDGLMFNTEEVYFQTGCRLMERRGGVYTQEMATAIMGTPPEVTFGKMLEFNHLDEPWQHLQAESEVVFFEILDTYLQPMPGLMELLAFLEARNIPKAICTSSSRKVMEGVLSRFQMQPRFAFTITGDEIEHGKPNPDIYLKAAAQFGIAAENMLVLEDSENGCRAGAGAHAFVTAVPAEHSRHMDFSMAQLVAESLADARIYQLLLPK